MSHGARIRGACAGRPMILAPARKVRAASAPQPDVFSRRDRATIFAWVQLDEHVTEGMDKDGRLPFRA